MSSKQQLFEVQIELDIKIGGRGSDTPDIECKFIESRPMLMGELLKFVQKCVENSEPEVARIVILPAD